MQTTRTTRIVSILVSLVLLGQEGTYDINTRSPRRRGDTEQKIKTQDQHASQYTTRQVLVFLNDIIRNIIPSNDAEILLVYYGYRVHPQAHGYNIVAFHPRVFQGYRIYFIPWEDHVKRTQLITYILIVIIIF